MFMSTEEDSELGSIKLQVVEGRDGLWGKTKQVKNILEVIISVFILVEGL